jgi:hypothetical protein
VLRAFDQSLRKSRTAREGEASGVPRSEKCKEQSAGGLLLGKARPLHRIVSGDDGANGAVLRAFDQALPDATDRRPERRGGMWCIPPRGRKCGGEDLELGKIIQEDHEFIVTRATTAIALHRFTQRYRSQSES